MTIEAVASYEKIEEEFKNFNFRCSLFAEVRPVAISRNSFLPQDELGKKLTLLLKVVVGCFLLTAIVSSFRVFSSNS